MRWCPRDPEVVMGGVVVGQEMACRMEEENVPGGPICSRQGGEGTCGR